MYDVMEDHGTTHTSVVDSEGMAVLVIEFVPRSGSHCEAILGWNHVNLKPAIRLACAGHTNRYVRRMRILSQIMSLLGNRRDLE